uniref:Uncharacterized protein n=1 Tax=Tetraselmis sp. GSL018 TaxID=582737 RepID=A0A061RFM2_9CHLO
MSFLRRPPRNVYGQNKVCCCCSGDCASSPFGGRDVGED